jgi:hypothetical protein
VYEELSEKVFTTGDSSSGEDRAKFQTFLAGLKAVRPLPAAAPHAACSHAHMRR